MLFEILRHYSKIFPNIRQYVSEQVIFENLPNTVSLIKKKKKKMLKKQMLQSIRMDKRSFECKRLPKIRTVAKEDAEQTCGEP